MNLKKQRKINWKKKTKLVGYQIKNKLKKLKIKSANNQKIN